MEFCLQCGHRNPDDAAYCSKCGTPIPGGGIPDASGSPTGASIGDLPTEVSFSSGFVVAKRYRIERELGMGGMGRVYLATDLTLQEPRAIKVLRDILRQDLGALARLKDEARLCLKLRHDNLVAVYHFDDADDVAFLVMEYVDGESLGALIARERRLPEEQVRRIGSQICDALAYAHKKKVIHRDLKPGNILLTKSGGVKVTDFGIARVATDSATRLTGTGTLGTMVYMAPEQVMGKAEAESDLYSLGVVLYEMLNGSPPFTTGNIAKQILELEPDPLNGVSPMLDALVLRLLSKAPEDRFATPEEVKSRLDEITVGEGREVALPRYRSSLSRHPDSGPGASGNGPPPRRDRWTRRFPLWAWASAVVLVLVVGVSFPFQRFSSRRGSEPDPGFPAHQDSAQPVRISTGGNEAERDTAATSESKRNPGVPAHQDTAQPVGTSTGEIKVEEDTAASSGSELTRYSGHLRSEEETEPPPADTGLGVEKPVVPPTTPESEPSRAAPERQEPTRVSPQPPIPRVAAVTSASTLQITAYECYRVAAVLRCDVAVENQGAEAREVVSVYTSRPRGTQMIDDQGRAYFPKARVGQDVGFFALDLPVLLPGVPVRFSLEQEGVPLNVQSVTLAIRLTGDDAQDVKGTAIVLRDIPVIQVEGNTAATSGLELPRSRPKISEFEAMRRSRGFGVARKCG